MVADPPGRQKQKIMALACILSVCSARNTSSKLGANFLISVSDAEPEG